MSTKIMALCWPLLIPPTAKSVLISLADNANDDGYCYPSITTICERTCFKRTAVIDAIAWLESVNLLSANRANGRHTTYTLTPSKYVETSPPNKPVRQTNQSVSREKPVRLPDKPVRQTDTNRQEPSKNRKYTYAPDDLVIAEAMSQKIQSVTLSTKTPNLEAWANTIRMIRQIDQRPPDLIRQVFAFANADQFWRSNILSADTLRKQFDKLLAKMNSGASYGQSYKSNKPRVDNSAAGRVRAAIARDRAARGELDGGPVGIDGFDVRPQVGEQLRGGGGPGQGVGCVLEGDFTRTD